MGTSGGGKDKGPPRSPLGAALDDLQSIDSDKRARAVISLSKGSSAEAIAPLSAAAEADENLSVRYLAQKQVESIRKAAVEGPPRLDMTGPDKTRGAGALDLERFAQGLADPDARVRINTVKIAMATRDPQAVEPLVAHAPKEEEPAVLAALLQAVGLLGGRERIPFLVEYLTGQRPVTPSVQAGAVAALGSIHQIAVYPYIVRALGDREAVVSTAAYRELKRLGMTNLVNLLRNMLAAKQGWMKKASLRACQILGRSSRVKAVLEERKDDADPAFRELVRRALEHLAAVAKDLGRSGADDPFNVSAPSIDVSQTGLALLIEQLPSDERTKMLQTFVDNKDTTKVPRLIEWLRGERDPRLTASILMALGKLGTADAVDTLATYLSSADGRIRANAVEALGRVCDRFGDVRVGGLLAPLLADRHNRVRANAVVALKGAGAAAETLEQMAYSGSPTYQRSAIYAISTLRKKEHRPLLEFLVRAKDRMVTKQAGEALEFFADAAAVPRLAAGQELTIREEEQEVRDQPSPAMPASSQPEVAGDDDAMVNPWDSTLLSEEEAASILRKKLKVGAKESAAADLLESVAASLVLASTLAFFVALVGIVVGLGLVLLDSMTMNDAQQVLLTVASGVLLVLAVEGLIPRPPDRPDAVRLYKRDAPKLFALIEKVADQLRVRKPESVLVHPYSELGLFEISGVPFLPYSGQLQLRLGLASLRALSVEQLRALLMAQLGMDVVVKEQFYGRVLLQMDSTLHQIKEKLLDCGDARCYGNPLFLFAMAFRAVFRLVTARPLNRFTLRADQQAARQVGRDVFTTALTKYCISARLFDQDLSEIVQSASQHGQSAAENIYAYYRGFLDGLNEKRLLRLKKEIFKYQPPGDRTLPGLQERLDAVAILPPGQDRPDQNQAASLLSNQDKIEREFSARFVDLGAATPPPPVPAAGVEKKQA